MAMVQRMKKELSELSKLGADSLIGAYPAPDGDQRHLIGWVKGPDDTPYEDGVFLIDIKLGEQYPFQPPQMKFITHLWHPNVSSVTGAICLDTLKTEWTPALTIRTALLSVLALFTAANPTDPQDHVVAKQYMTDMKAFEQKAREWSELYGVENIGLYKGPRNKSTKPTTSSSTTTTPVTTPKVDTTPFKYQRELNQLTEMGFDASQARRVLESTKGNIDEAISKFATL